MQNPSRTSKELLIAWSFLPLFLGCNSHSRNNYSNQNQTSPVSSISLESLTNEIPQEKLNQLVEDIEILEALFGDIAKVGMVDTLFAVFVSCLAIYIISKISRGLLLDTISKDLAKSAGINTSKIDLIFLLLVGVIVALGIKVAGALLTGALVIIPAAAAKNISSNFRDFSILSLLF